MVEDSRTGKEAEATADETAVDDAGEGRPHETPAGHDDADTLAEEAEAFVDGEASDSAVDVGDETGDDGGGAAEDATADASSAGGRNASDRGKSKAELDRELESMNVGAGAAEHRAEAGPEREQAADSTVAAGPVTGPHSADGTRTDPAIAGLLSFFVPGLGNVYNGQSGRGLIGLAIWAAWLLLGWGLGGVFFGIFLGLATYGLMFVLTGIALVVAEFVIHLVAAYDAYNQAGKINAGQVDV